MSRQFLSRFEVKELDEDARTFTGLAATYDLDLGGDVIKPGAFKRTLKGWKSSKRVLPLLDSHNAHSTVRNVVGKMTDGEETKDGLLSTFEVIDGPDGDEIYRRVKGGFVDGLSIGYSAVKVKYPTPEEEQATGVYRYLEEVKLHEVSVVLWPMNPEARIDTASVKAAILAAKGKDNLTDDERAELKALQKELDALLVAPEPAQPTQEALADLFAKIDRLQFHRLATRIESARHSGEELLDRLSTDT